MPDTLELRRLAERYLAGGVMHHISAFGGRPPIVVARGRGSHIWDTDGRDYIDYYLGSACIILGHADPAVTEAVRRQIELGTQFYELNEPAIELAQLVVEAFAGAERIKYAMSGMEAIGAAIRVARAHTGKSRILKFEGAYHGSHDWTMWGYRHRQPLAYPRAEPDSAGIPRELQDYVLVAPYNDLEAFAAIVDQHRADLAAVIAAPGVRNVRPLPGFLEGVRDITRAHDIPLIFDEVVMAFRMAMAGAQEIYGVTPDLSAIGKAVGGGHPIGALVGRADLMDRFSPARLADRSAVLHVGTYSGNPVSAAAGVATVRALQQAGSFERLHALGRSLGLGLREIGGRIGVPLQVAIEGPMVEIWFSEHEIRSFADTWRADAGREARFKLGLIERGIWAPPGHRMFLSLAHSDGDIHRTLEAAEASMRSL